jgi:hypothetical protein
MPRTAPTARRATSPAGSASRLPPARRTTSSVGSGSTSPPARRTASPAGSSSRSQPARRTRSVHTDDATAARRSARQGIVQLQELNALRASKRARHHLDPLPDSDTDEDANHPILDMFQEIGRESVLKLSNFTVAEISRLWGRVSGFMASRWNVGKGNKHRESGMDILFISLCVLKNGGRWDLLASTFHPHLRRRLCTSWKSFHRTCTRCTWIMPSATGRCERKCLLAMRFNTTRQHATPLM